MKKRLSKSERIKKILESAKKVAAQYYKETGRSLGVTGEVGELEAIEKLKLKQANVQEAGHDATDWKGKKRYEIKTRLLDNGKRIGRVGIIKLKPEFDYALLVLMNKEFENLEIWKAKYSDVKKALTKPGSKRRNEHGQLSVSTFVKIAEQVWPK